MKIDKKAMAALSGKDKAPFAGMTVHPTHDGKFMIHHHMGHMSHPTGAYETHIAENKEQLAEHMEKHADKMEPSDSEEMAEHLGMGAVPPSIMG